MSQAGEPSPTAPSASSGGDGHNLSGEVGVGGLQTGDALIAHRFPDAPSHISLGVDPWTARAVLFNALTLERAVLPVGCWELDFQEGQGWLYRSTGDNILDALEVDEFLLKSVYQCGDLMYVVWEMDGHRVKQEMSMQRLQHRGVSIDIGLGECASSAARVDLAEWSVAEQGVKYSWNLLSLFGALGFTTGQARTAGRWVVDGFVSWAKFLTDALQLPPKHISKSKPYNKADGVVTIAPADEGRILPFPSVSTHGLFGLLLRWAWGAHRLRGQGRTAKVVEFLRSLILQLGGDLAAAPLDGFQGAASDGRSMARALCLCVGSQEWLRADRRHERVEARGLRLRLALGAVALGFGLRQHAG